MGKKKLFDFCIGNPPYQEEQVSNDADGSKKNYAPPVYNIFMDAANSVSERTELIHPARFLFNAGSTPKAWNQKMLNDDHFKVVKYEEDSEKVFPSLATPLKGGVAITYHDDEKSFGAIKTFTQFPQLNEIVHSIIASDDFHGLSDIVYSRTSYRLTDKVHQDYPDIRYHEDKDGNNLGLLSKGHDYDMSSNIFERVPMLFHDEIPDDGKQYVKIIGRLSNKRTVKYIRRDYINNVDNFGSYKVLLPQAHGNGTFGEAIPEPFVEGPGVANTETFISMGKFETETVADDLKKYICTKFARTMLGVLKVTQNANKPVWQYVPLQDFTSSSDIDWSQSIADIDQQLYRKYNLTPDEINFIETHVKEMD